MSSSEARCDALPNDKTGAPTPPMISNSSGGAPVLQYIRDDTAGHRLGGAQQGAAAGPSTSAAAAAAAAQGCGAQVLRGGLWAGA
eukprot:SAG31_NODE_9991_length_1200_cov_1.384196_2_plen_85_part_00